MKFRSLGLLFAVMSLLCIAKAQVVLDFEGLQHQELIESAYNGGTGSFGTTLTNSGVSFSEWNTARIYPNWAVVPSGVTFALLYPNCTINVSEGFVDHLKFN